MGELKSMRRSRSTTIIFFTVAIMMNIIFLMKGTCASSTGILCNGTTTGGDCFSSSGDGEIGEEIGRGPYSVGGRWLLQTGDHITYRGLESSPVCSNAANYADCINPRNSNKLRACLPFQRCRL